MANITNTEAAAAIANIIPRQVQRFLKQNIVFPNLVGHDYDATDIREHGDRVTIIELGNISVNTKAQGSNVTRQAPSLTGTAVTLIQPEATFALDHLTKIQARPDLLSGYARKSGIAMAEYINSYIASTVYPLAGNTIDALAGFDADDVYEADRLLNDVKIPVADRYGVLGQDAKKEAMGLDVFTKHEYQGPAGWAALQKGMLGELAGFDHYMSQGVTETGGEVKNLYFSKDSIQMVSRPLDTGMNGLGGQVGSYHDKDTGLTIRTLVWFDFDEQSWVMTVDCLFGLKVVEADGVVCIRTTDV